MIREDEFSNPSEHGIEKKGLSLVSLVIFSASEGGLGSVISGVEDG